MAMFAIDVHADGWWLPIGAKALIVIKEGFLCKSMVIGTINNSLTSFLPMQRTRLPLMLVLNMISGPDIGNPCWRVCNPTSLYILVNNISGPDVRTVPKALADLTTFYNFLLYGFRIRNALRILTGFVDPIALYIPLYIISALVVVAFHFGSLKALSSDAIIEFGPDMGLDHSKQDFTSVNSVRLCKKTFLLCVNRIIHRVLIKGFKESTEAAVKGKRYKDLINHHAGKYKAIYPPSTHIR